ncbi:unnamed protein product [Didymodactylos carnosus]|uniref:PITH domain-containing protein n=1 Tax=Didymodactylos carnosus TaxID=1234261 RepID=A0A814XWJ0_9BILA|nr:unnamed protein product [Didymodactylos carnosus]CAF1221328.1 unnamed protein product [Didymodactylos carnosus]CAF3894041.1 unnamed protein product [Didymodactylos carnosus]CAF3984616.1 unnamed protein product [Didymodactylos carnosus]
MQHSCTGSCQHVDESDRGKWDLYQKIDLNNLQCLNEQRNGSGKDVFRCWDERLDRSKFVESDDDPELLFKIPFSGNIKLTGICIIGENEGSHPSHVKLFKNKPGLTFESARNLADQELDITYDPNGTLAYPVLVARFSNVNHLSLYFSHNYGAETTKIYYIGLRGEFLGGHRQEIVIANYESKPQLSDHKTDLFQTTLHQIQH